MTIGFAPLGPGTKSALHSGIAAGTIVLTQAGARTIETLKARDKIITRDRGLQPLRRVINSVANVPQIHFAAGAMGAHDAITLAPTTRVLIRTPLVKALLGEAEVFALARDLVNGTTIRTLPGAAPVQMVHLLFDRAEILRAAEMEVESLDAESAQIEAETQAALRRLLPNVPQLSGYASTGRPCLLHSDARLFSAGR
jgi:hypothetical protein